VNAQKQLQIGGLPSVLCMQLKRFELVQLAGEKVAK
jgi:ubiquitin C-terminal hydrolase